MIVSLQNTPFALLMQGLRLRTGLTRSSDTANAASSEKSAMCPHWIDFLNDGEDQAER